MTNRKDKTPLLDDTYNSELQESLGALPDIQHMSTAYRGEGNLMRSQNFHDGPSSAMNGPSVQTINTERHGGSMMPTRSMMYTASHMSAFHRSTAIYATPEEGGKGTSGIVGGLMIINAALGAGVLNFPSAFAEAGGVYTANVVQLVSQPNKIFFNYYN